MTSAGTIEDAKGPAELRLALRQMLGEDIVLSETEEMLRFCRDWHGDVTTGTVAVIRPRSTQQVAAAVKACRELGLSIVPQGGNTGLVLGAIPDAPRGRSCFLSPA